MLVARTYGQYMGKGVEGRRGGGIFGHISTETIIATAEGRGGVGEEVYYTLR